MSTYYNYYIGYKKDGKVYPFGPYNFKNQIRPILSRSRSFASDLWQKFADVRENEISEELRKDFSYKEYDGTERVSVKYLPLSELPEGSFIKSGYFLIEDVEDYEKDPYDFDGFYNHISPTVYAAKLDHEIKFGKNKPKKDAEGFEYTEPSASDYMFYAYPDWHSEEYEADVIRQFCGEFVDWETKNEVDEIGIILEIC